MMWSINRSTVGCSVSTKIAPLPPVLMARVLKPLIAGIFRELRFFSNPLAEPWKMIHL